MKLSNQVAIVTGAGRNIGEEISKTLAAEGGKVAVVDLDKGRGDRVAAEITRAGGEAAAFVADVAAETDVARVVAAVVARWGRIEILVNNAAISDNKNILDITKAQWDAVIAVTLTGPFLMSQQAARQMVAQGSGGKIVNVGSTSGFFGRSRAVAYAAAKGGVANLTRQLALSWAPQVRVNCVCPGVIETPMTEALLRDRAWVEAALTKYPLGRFGQPEEIAAAILYLASDEAAYVTGVALPVDGGYTAI